MEEKIMYEAKKHWFFWFFPVLFSLIFLFTLILPPIILLWAFLRWKFDKIEIKDGCLYSRLGVISIDKKVIPLDKISFASEKTDILGQLIGVGSLIIQSSASGGEIVYAYIDRPSEFIRMLNEAKEKQ